MPAVSTDDEQPAEPEDRPSGSGTPPRAPPASGRPREEDKTTPPAPAGQPRKRHRAAAAPSARHGLSFSAAPAPSEAESWRGHSYRLEVIWRVSSNLSGSAAATAAMRHHLCRFADRQARGCSVEFREHADRIELFVDLINERAVPGDAALGISKQLYNALKNVTRSANKQVSQCHFAVRVRETNAQLVSDVLKRIDGDIPPRDGFRSWCKRRPAPPEPAPGAAVSDRTPGEVSVVLGLELSNLRSEFHVAVSTKDLDSCCSKALTTLELLHKYMLGLAASPAPAASGTPASLSPCAKSDLPRSLLTPGRLFQARTLLLAHWQQTRPRPTPLRKTPPAQLAPWPVRPPLPCCPAAVSPDALS